MFQFEAEKHVPKFLMADKNGRAVAMAIQAAVQYMNDRIAEGVAVIDDFDRMPEWRLDDLAWEYNCLYDYEADVKTKRQWVRNAVPLYRMFGTVQSIYQYVGGYFANMDVEENWQYGGEPYHFRVTVEGEWTPENERWARKAINEAKNVRSILDSLRIGHKCFVGVIAEGEMLGRFSYPITGLENWAGRWPDVNTLGRADDTGKAGLAAEAAGARFWYPVTGTRPNVNTAASVDESGKTGMAAEAAGNLFSYQVTGEEATAGRWPQESRLGVAGENDISAAKAEDTYAKLFYKMCGADEL